MLRAPECLYKSKNVHERPGFCHQRTRVDASLTPLLFESM